MLRILNSGINTAEANMRLDAQLLLDLKPEDEPLLHFYAWQGPSATYGHFVEPTQHFYMHKVHKNRLTLARRPTGGGIVFHIWDFAFSFLMPSNNPHFSQNTLVNYRFVNEVVKDVMQGIFKLQDQMVLTPADIEAGYAGFCMAKPTIYDVLYDGRKIAGAAQRRRKNGYLHQGTISLALPQEELLSEVLISQEEVIESMMAYTFAPLGKFCKPRELEEMRSFIQQRLAENFRNIL